jgi:hypothetical protein
LKTHQKFLAHAALICCTWPVAALAGDYGTVYTQIGTNGLGIGYAASLSPDWALRGQFNSFKQSFSGNVGDFGAGSVLTTDLNLNSVPLLADWYPSDGGFRLTGGLVFNNNKITIAGTGNVGSSPPVAINAEIKLSDSVSPYLGLGYATRPKDAKGLGFNFDLGAMMQNPSVSLTAPGATTADIEAQRVKILDAVNNLKVMPVFGLGINYAF